MDTKNFFRKKDTVNGRCSHCGLELYDEEDEPAVSTIIRLTEDDHHPTDTLIDEWCSKECFISDMKGRVQKLET
jgi:hypothetical protein